MNNHFRPFPYGHLIFLEELLLLCTEHSSFLEYIHDHPILKEIRYPVIKNYGNLITTQRIHSKKIAVYIGVGCFLLLGYEIIQHILKNSFLREFKEIR
jgi:hypothetical protein